MDESLHTIIHNHQTLKFGPSPHFLYVSSKSLDKGTTLDGSKREFRMDAPANNLEFKNQIVSKRQEDLTLP